jgi:RES domain
VIAYRAASYDTPLRTIPASWPARFNRVGDSAPTQYLCLHPLGPHAELMRNAELRTPDQVRVMRLRTWALEVNVDDLPEITFENAGDFGISAADLVADEQSSCGQLAAELRPRGGAIVPSAALPGTRNLVLFGERVAAPYGARPVSSLDIPTSLTAHRGRPPTSLIALVRYRGDAHVALDAWEQGRVYRFSEPDWSLVSDPVS